MNFEFIVKDEARRFFKYGRWFGRTNGPTEMKDDLESLLYNHEESTAKLMILYEVLKCNRDKYDKHLLQCPHKNEPKLCVENVYYIKCIYYIEQLIKGLNPKFDFTILRPQVDAELIHENLKMLSSFPNSGKLYQSALDKLNEHRNDRNLLDDLRLSLETLMKELLNNNKSLENQKKHLGLYLKQIDVSSECRNMFITLIDYYCNYQNTYIKHNDQVRQDEVELIVNLTSSLINFLIVKYE